MKFKKGDKVKVRFTGEVVDRDRGTTLPYCVKLGPGCGEGQVWVRKEWIKPIKPKAAPKLPEWIEQVERRTDGMVLGSWTVRNNGDHVRIENEEGFFNSYDIEFLNNAYKDTLALVNEVKKLSRALRAAFRKLDKRKSVRADRDAVEIPEGWNSADEPPDTDRDVEIKDIDYMEAIGCFLSTKKKWSVESKNGAYFDAIPIAWREIQDKQPKPYSLEELQKLDGWNPIETLKTPDGTPKEVELLVNLREYHRGYKSKDGGFYVFVGEYVMTVPGTPLGWREIQPKPKAPAIPADWRNVNELNVGSDVIVEMMRKSGDKGTGFVKPDGSVIFLDGPWVTGRTVEIINDLLCWRPIPLDEMRTQVGCVNGNLSVASSRRIVPSGWRPMAEIKPSDGVVEIMGVDGAVVRGFKADDMLCKPPECKHPFCWRPIPKVEIPTPKFRGHETVCNLKRGLFGEIIGVITRNGWTEYIVRYDEFSAHEPESALSKVGGE